MEWKLLAEIAPDLLDGRAVLGFNGKRMQVINYFDGSKGDDPGWYVVREYPFEPTHIAEIEAP